MTAVFLGLLLSVLAISAAGISSALAARRREKGVPVGRRRTFDSAAVLRRRQEGSGDSDIAEPQQNKGNPLAWDMAAGTKPKSEASVSGTGG